jgi:UPF0271 protein
VSTRVALVADLGESFGAYRMGDDAALLDVVTSANIACGFHAGDPRVMAETVAACVRRGVAIGAHPGFADLVGFGRRALDVTPDQLHADLLYQLGALDAFARTHGTRVRHVTPHGALGNLVMGEPRYARTMVDALAGYDPAMAVVTLDGPLAVAARDAGLPVALLALADRAYTDTGALVRRCEPGAVLTGEAEVARRAVRMVTEGAVRAVTGRDIAVTADAILLHGDTPGAVGLAHAVRAALLAAGVEIVPLASVLATRAAA